MFSIINVIGFITSISFLLYTLPVSEILATRGSFLQELHCLLHVYHGYFGVFIEKLSSLIGCCFGELHAHLCPHLINIFQESC